jgi:hypothetical protein
MLNARLIFAWCECDLSSDQKYEWGVTPFRAVTANAAELLHGFNSMSVDEVFLYHQLLSPELTTQ